MPQINQILETYASQFFWLLIVFGLIYFTIGHGMLPKIEASMDARDRKIADDLAAAERARTEADNLGDSGAADLTAARNARKPNPPLSRRRPQRTPMRVWRRPMPKSALRSLRLKQSWQRRQPRHWQALKPLRQTLRRISSPRFPVPRSHLRKPQQQ